MQRVVRSSLVGLLTLAGLTACGDKVTVPPTQTTPPDQVVHSVTVTPSSVSLKVGDKVTLAASVDAGAGVTNRGVTWSTSSATVATVDANGTVTAVAGGTATIIAKSAADPTVSGAAVVQVAATVPAAVTVGQINQTVCVVGGACTSIPANLSNVAGQLDVTLNVDPGTQTITGVDLIMNCGGADTVVATQNLGSADKAPIAAEESNAPVTLSFNTAAFTAANGSVAFKNGACTLKGRVRTASGNIVASSGTSLTLNNADILVATTTVPNSAPGANGLVWRGGAVTVSAVPVMYSGATIASGTVQLMNAAGAAHPTQYGQGFGITTTTVASQGVVQQQTNIAPSAGVISATFSTSTSAAGGVGGASVDSMFTQITTVSSTGNAGPAILLPTPPAIGAGSPVGNAFVRLDNRAPDITTLPVLTMNVQNNQNNWAGSAFTFTTNSTGTAAFSSTPVITFAAGTLTDWGGVDLVKAITQSRVAGSGASFVTFSKITDLAETSSSGSYELRLQVCDALNNCQNATPAGNTFGVDLTAPTLATLAGVKDGDIYSIATGAPVHVAFSVLDPTGAGGVSGSGTSTNGILVKDQSLKPGSSIPGSKTECSIGVDQGSGSAHTCAAGVPRPNDLVFATSDAIAAQTGEYTMVVNALDQAGNTSPSVTIKYYVDLAAPTIPVQGVTIPGSITLNTAFTGFSATDNMDIKSGSGSLVFTSPAFQFAEGGTASPAGVAFDNVLTQQSTVGTTLSVFYKSLTNAVGTTATKPSSLSINVIDAAGNQGTPMSTPLPDANIAALPTTLFNAGTNAITAFAIDSTKPAGATDDAGKPFTFYVNATPLSDATGNPLSQVCFYWLATSANQFGSGAAANDLVKLGCTGGIGTTGVGTTRRFAYVFTQTFPAAFGPTPVSFQVFAVGNTSTLDAIISAPVTVTINTPP